MFSCFVRVIACPGDRRVATPLLAVPPEILLGTYRYYTTSLVNYDPLLVGDLIFNLNALYF